MPATPSLAPAVRCALYLRVSLDATGEMLAVARQREACQAIAAARGWTVVAEYVDNSISASDKLKDRPGYNALEQDYRAGRFDALLCWDLDRLTRQPRQLEDWIDAAEERGLLLVTANGEADLTTDGGRTYARVKMAFARGESDRKGARQKAAAAQRAELGRPPLGVRLTGYTSKGELVEHEAVVVRQVFARFASGDSLRSIAAWLGATELRPRHGDAWNPSSVRTMLTNPRYAGRAVYQGKPTGQLGSWEALVDEATFDAIQARLDDPRRRTHAGTDRRWLGSGLYYCGTCEGERLTGWSQARYCCRQCGMTRSRTQVDDFVLAVLRGRLARPDLHELMPAREDPELTSATAAVTALRHRLEVIEHDYDEGLIDGRRFAVAREKVETDLRTAVAAQARVMAARGSVPLLSAPDPVAAFDDAPLMVQRAVLDTLMEVSLPPGVRYSRTFDPATVRISWRS